MAVLSSREKLRERFKEAIEHERALERHGHTYRSRLTAQQRAYWRVTPPALIGIFSEIYFVCRVRNRFRPGEVFHFEKCFANWDRFSHEELTALENRLMELKGLFNADWDLESCRLR